MTEPESMHQLWIICINQTDINLQSTSKCNLLLKYIQDTGLEVYYPHHNSMASPLHVQRSDVLIIHK